MRDSESISRSFYDRLGATGLAARTTPAWDSEIVRRLVAMLVPGQQVLDLGCGYGRTAIPLAMAGFDVTALDISDVLLAAARTEADRRKARVTWLCESMCRIPLPDQSVDVALSLWSAFHELLQYEEQIVAILKIYRVLRSPGWALIEGAVYTELTQDNRISADLVEGLENPHFRHDASTLSTLMEESGVAKYEVYVDDWAGRPRQFLRFEK